MFVILGLLLVSLSGCSAVRLAYEQGDWLLARYMDDWLDLDATQEQLLAVELERWMEEHRRYEIPLYLAFLRDFRSAAADGLTRAEIDRLFDTGAAVYRSTATRAAALAAPVLADLSPEQVEHLARRIDENNREYSEKYLRDASAGRLSARAEVGIERLERWTGRLQESQVRLITRMNAGLPDTAEPWSEYRKSQQQELLRLLREGAGTERVQAHLESWWVFRGDQPPALRAAGRRLVEGLREMSVAVDATLDARQRQHLLNKIDDLIDDLEAVAQPPRQADQPQWPELEVG